MKRIALVVCCALLVFGCVQVVATAGLDTKERIPNVTFMGYFCAVGHGEVGRAVLLVDPSQGVEVDSVSSDISEMPATFSDARSFMNAKAFGRDIVEQRVIFRGKPVGYFFTYGSSSSMRDPLRADVSERGGKLQFNTTDYSERD
jgi:hypothetical protein